MTNREFLTAVANFASMDTEALAKFDFNEVSEMAAAALTKLDAANEKKRNTPTKAQIENAPLLAALEDILSETPICATEVGTKLGVTTQKASALLRILVKNGKAVSADGTKPDGKGACKVYTRA